MSEVSKKVYFNADTRRLHVDGCRFSNGYLRESAFDLRESAFKNKFFRDLKKGQALTEFAIFGSILLFCVGMLLQYGLEANYQQQVQMEAFRKAQKIAFYKSGPNASTTLVLLKDKPLPDPRDQWGYAERYPVVSGANVVWDTNLSADYVEKFTETPQEKDLPAMYFEIDKGDLSQVRSLRKKADVNAARNAGQNNVFGFYTSRFDREACPPVITVVFPDPARKYGKEYIEFPVKWNDIKVMRLEGGFGSDEVLTDTTELLMYPFFLYDSRYPGGDGTKRRITDADIDGDGKLEYIIAANEAKVLFYIVSHDKAQTSSNTIAGATQIDTDYTQILAGDWVWDKKNNRWIELAPKDRQGMLPDFQKTIQIKENKIVKGEEKGKVTSSTNLNATQKITHKIRLNDGTQLDIPAEFTVNAKDLYKW